MNRRSLLSIFAFLAGSRILGEEKQKQKVKVMKFAGALWVSNMDELFGDIKGEKVGNLIRKEIIAWLPEENALYLRVDGKDKLAYGLVKFIKKEWKDTIHLSIEKIGETFFKDIKDKDFCSIPVFCQG